ncbi:prostacyclin receptor isoform X2 [Chiloscyllium plagiosum]|uniref:prostacyclin receptor isoform X2 n=1 Tax=Chiloscyllium plagiosum TaxID=36176 RepID=UPI001CB852A1|nr:prostacyclin receptor isoform X2 [Chiloscyllium plagiosum]
MNNTSCESTHQIQVDSQPVVSIMMFSGGVVGNVLALALLGVHRKELRTKSSVFCILVTGLAITDLMGTCCLSPVVFVAYAQGLSLLGLAGGPGLCHFFSSAMTFFGLASTLLLFAMAAERCLAISHPYLYPQHVGRSRAKLALPAAYTFAGLFSLLPVTGFGQHKQYCPGTWCFLRMESRDSAAVGFSLLYASLIALLVLAVILCNASVIVNLCKMHRSQRSRRGSVLSSQRKGRRRSIFGQREEEIDHLILLVSMTAIFSICSLPLTIWQGNKLPDPVLLEWESGPHVVGTTLIQAHSNRLPQGPGCHSNIHLSTNMPWSKTTAGNVRDSNFLAVTGTSTSLD